MTEQRNLGSTCLSVAPLVAGGNVFGWTIDEKTSFDVLDAWADAGVTMIDTADVYSSFVPGNAGGESETIIGKWMKSRGNRANIQIATKVGMQPIGDLKGLNPPTIAAGIDASLRRLQTDHVDLYYAHFDDESATQEAVAEAFDGLVRAGKVRALGASNFAQARLTSALEIAKTNRLASYGALQPHFNLMSPEKFPADYRQYCIDQNIGVLSYFALASGFLTGKYRSADDAGGAARAQLLTGYFSPRGDKVLATLDRIAGETGATPAQIALAWVMATPGITAPIASATSIAQVESLVPAMDLSLSDEQMAALDAASATAI